MLVLSRKSGEKILVSDEVAITVVAIQGGRVRIRVEAPPEVRVRRREFVTRPDLLIATKGDPVRSLDHRDG